jgi:hypothetical protein
VNVQGAEVSEQIDSDDSTTAQNPSAEQSEHREQTRGAAHNSHESQEESAAGSESESEKANEKPGGKPRILSFFENLWKKLLRLIELIKRILEWLFELPMRIGEIAEALSNLWERFLKLLQKPGEFRDLLNKLEARGILSDVIGYLQYLIRHIRPRRIKGYLRFGTGDPAMSAQLTGLIYLLLPARADKFTIETEFNEAVFETDLICSGHLRVCHAVKIGIQAFRNKRIRRMIRYLRHKEDK